MAWGLDQVFNILFHYDFDQWNLFKTKFFEKHGWDLVIYEKSCRWSLILENRGFGGIWSQFRCYTTINLFYLFYFMLDFLWNIVIQHWVAKSVFLQKRWKLFAWTHETQFSRVLDHYEQIGKSFFWKLISLLFTEFHQLDQLILDQIWFFNFKIHLRWRSLIGNLCNIVIKHIKRPLLLILIFYKHLSTSQRK